MQGRNEFTSADAAAIRALLSEKLRAQCAPQKRMRAKLRQRYGFYISDFGRSLEGFGPEDFDELARVGRVRIINDVGTGAITSAPVPSVQCAPTITVGHGKDEGYVIDLCDAVLGAIALRQHRFSFLCGDRGTCLPVDAYYPTMALVIEYREVQHTKAVPHFDRRQTVSGVSRGQQRRLYDERRREVLPRQGIRLFEIEYSELDHGGDGRLHRNRNRDLDTIRRKLSQWLPQR